MNAPERQDIEARQRISELVDGRADDPAAVEQACARWPGDAELRRTWHAYHLIGDVLRSEELAGAPARDSALLVALRERLAQEPVVLAPAARPPLRAARGARRQVWLLPLAAAAGLVAVAGVLVVLQQADLAAPGGAGPLLAQGSPAAPGVLPVAAAPAAADPSAQMLRDARVEDYLRAHRETLAGSPAALPGGAMRSSFEFSVPQR